MRPGGLDTDERPLVLVWECTQACELSCDHCRADATPERDPDELSTAEAEDLLDEARRFGDGQVVVLSGGDPLSRSDAVDLVGYGADIGLSMAMTPSAAPSLSPGVVEDLADAGLRRLAISLDGAGAATHDDFRGEPGNFEATMAAARAARDAGLSLQINTTVCAATADDLPGVRERVLELGADRWVAFFLVPVGRGAALESVSPERAEAICSWLVGVDRSDPVAVSTTEAPHYRRIAVQAGEEVVGPRITAGDGFAFVSHRGEVFPSGFLPRSVGSVREDSLVELYREAPLFRRLRDPDALKGDCGDCEYRAVCGGSRSRAYAVHGDPLASDPLCAYSPEGTGEPAERRAGD